MSLSGLYLFIGLFLIMKTASPTGSDIIESNQKTLVAQASGYYDEVTIKIEVLNEKKVCNLRC